MTTVIIPTRSDVDMLGKCLDSLFAANKIPRLTIVVEDCCEETAVFMESYIEQHEGLPLQVIHNEENIGFWHSLTKASEQLPDDEPFCYFGKDVVFTPDWLIHAESFWQQKVSRGLGLISFRDDMVDHGNASHGMLTKNWMYVVYGERQFPDGYWHYFCDSELTCRSRDLGRYFFCKKSHVPHHHKPTGHRPGVLKGHRNDGDSKRSRDVEWVNGERENAKRRLSNFR